MLVKLPPVAVVDLSEPTLNGTVSFSPSENSYRRSQHSQTARDARVVTNSNLGF